MKISPEPSPEMLPSRPRPRVTRLAMRFIWLGSSGASVATTTMIEPVSSSHTGLAGNFVAYGRARDAQEMADSKIALHQHADRVAALFFG